MRIGSYRLLLFAAMVAIGLQPAIGQSKAEPKSAPPRPQSESAKSENETVKPEIETLDPSGRPEGAINDQSSRIYLWHDEGGWRLRTTARVTRTFSGVIRVKDAKIMSCVPVGLKNDRKQKTPDVWKVNDARDELQFTFSTGRLSDGLDVVVKGDNGQIEFDMHIDNQQNHPKEVFIGRDRNHPTKSPFVFPANPPISKAPDKKKKL